MAGQYVIRYGIIKGKGLYLSKGFLWTEVQKKALRFESEQEAMEGKAFLGSIRAVRLSKGTRQRAQFRHGYVKALKEFALELGGMYLGDESKLDYNDAVEAIRLRLHEKLAPLTTLLDPVSTPHLPT